MDCLGSQNPEKLPTIGAWFKSTPEGYVVSMVLDGSSAAQADLRKGDIVTSVDGLPFTPVTSLTAAVGKTVTLKFKRGDEVLSAQVAVRSDTAMNVFNAATDASARVLSVNGRRWGYVHMWTLLGDQSRNLLTGMVYGKLKDTDGMILDLRDGFGGSPDGFGDPFFRPEVQLEWRSGTNVSKSVFGYGRPMVVLINGGSRSAKEMLTFILKKAKRATVVGQRTAGYVLATSPTRISDWGYLELPLMELYIDGVRLEAKGVAPDVEVPQEFDKNGRDLILDAGERVLEKQVPGRQAA
jgi:carboxyl-terminal processing protease